MQLLIISKKNDSVYEKIKKKKCIKLVFKLLIHNEMYNGYYNNTQWWFYLGKYYKEQKNTGTAMNKLGYNYKEQKDYDNMLKYYLMSIDKGNDNAMCNLGNYHKEQKKYDKMKKYYLMAIEKGHDNA